MNGHNYCGVGKGELVRDLRPICKTCWKLYKKATGATWLAHYIGADGVAVVAPIYTVLTSSSHTTCDVAYSNSTATPSSGSTVFIEWRAA